MTGIERLAGAILVVSLFGGTALAAGEGRLPGEETAYIVYDYRYDPAGSDGDPDTGHALCATRCNALSFDYADYLMADARELQRVAAGRELTVSLDNPFLGGQCICTVDEYLIKPNLRNRPRSPEGK
jgi:hypothetical protein